MAGADDDDNVLADVVAEGEENVDAAAKNGILVAAVVVDDDVAIEVSIILSALRSPDEREDETRALGDNGTTRGRRVNETPAPSRVIRIIKIEARCNHHHDRQDCVILLVFTCVDAFYGFN